MDFSPNWLLMKKYGDGRHIASPVFTILLSAVTLEGNKYPGNPWLSARRVFAASVSKSSYFIEHYRKCSKYPSISRHSSGRVYVPHF